MNLNFLNEDRLNDRLRYIPYLSDAAERLTADWQAGDPLQDLAQQRILHVAAEVVTDIGNLLIDGFFLRDPSSYEDIVTVVADEGVVPAEWREPLLQLVRLRKSLVQEYAEWMTGERHALIDRLPGLLAAFRDGVGRFIETNI